MTSRDYAINQAWCAAVSMACDLLAWLRLLALTGDLTTAEPKTLRYRLLHTAGRIVRGQRRRRRRLTIPETWPWAHDLHQAFTKIWACNHPDPHQPSRRPRGTPPGPWNRRPPDATAGPHTTPTTQQQDPQRG
ncbi:MAG: transposase [Pseudonocardiaceae bacterium]